MAVFRKIVSSLVVVSYIKTQIFTSFAVDIAPAFPPVRYKLKVDRQVTPQGTLKHLELVLQEKDLQTGLKKTLRQDRITSGAEVPADDIDWTTENKRDTGYKWHSLPGFGAVRVNFDGHIFLENISALDQKALFKVKGNHLITFHNCHFSHLQTTAMSTIFLGRNTIETLESKATIKQGGIYCYARKSEPTGTVSIKNLRLEGDNFVNHSRLVVPGTGSWDLGSGDYINSGVVTCEGAPHKLKNVRLFSNANQITGKGMTIEAHSYVNEVKGRITLETHSVKSTELLMNEGAIHTTVHGNYQWKGEAFNKGQITSDQTYSVGTDNPNETAVLYNHAKMTAKTGTFGAVKVINEGEIRQEQSIYQNTSLDNRGLLELGVCQDTSSVAQLINKKTLTAMGRLKVKQGENTGSLTFNTGSFMVERNGRFINKGIISLLNLIGEGTFINEGSYRLSEPLKEGHINIATFVTAGSEPKLEGDSLTLGEKLRNFQINDHTRAEISSLKVKKTNLSAQPLELRGQLSCDTLTIERDDVHIAGNFLVEKLYVNSRSSVLAGGLLRSRFTTLTHTTLTNQGRADLGRLTLNQGLLHNHATLRVQPTKLFGDIDASRIINSGRFETRFIDRQDPNYWNQHLLLSTLLDNSGQLVIDGDYTPAVTTLRGKSYNDPVRPGQGTLEITGTLHLDSNKIDTLYPFFTQGVRAEQVTLKGYGQNILLRGDMDWRFAKKFHIHNGKSVVCRGDIKVNSPSFEGVHTLWIKDLFQVSDGDFQAHDLTCFQLGIDNANLGKLLVETGKVTISSKNNLDLRYGSIEATKPVLLKSTQQNVLIGSRGVKTAQTYRPPNNWLHAATYEKSHLNGAYVITADNLTIEAPKGKILIDYGQLQAGNGLTLRAPQLIRNLSGKLTVIGDVYLYGNTFQQTRPPLRTFGARSPNPNYINIVYSLEDADPANFDVIGNLYCYMDNFINEYSDVLISQNFIYQDAVVDVKKLPPTIRSVGRETYYREYEVGTGIWYTHHKRTPATPAAIKVGEEIDIKIGSVEVSGSMSAPIVTIHTQTASCSNPRGHRSAAVPQETVVINVNEALAVLQQDPAYRMFQLGGSTMPSLATTLVDGEMPEGTIVNPLTGFNLDFYLYKIFSQYAGRAYMKQGKALTSGFELVEQLKKNSQSLKGKEREETTDVPEEEDINFQNLSHIFYKFKRLKEAHEQQLYMSIATRHINAHQGAGDIDGEKIKIHTTEAQEHQGNAVHGAQTVELSSDNLLTATSSSITGDEACDLTAHTIDLRRDVHRVYNAYGYTEHLGAVAEVGSSKGKLTVTTMGDLALAGVHGFGLKGIDLTVGGNYIADTVATESDQTYGSKKCRVHEHHLVNHGNHFMTGKYVNAQFAADLPAEQQGHTDMTVRVGGNTFVRGGTAEIDGDHTRHTEGSTTIAAAIDVHQIETISKKRRGWRKKRIQETNQRVRAQRSHINAKQRIHEKAKGSLSVQAVDWRAGGKITLESEEGRINLLHAMSIDYQAVKKSSSDGLWDCNSQSGRLDESVQLCHFVSEEDQGIQFIAAEGITVELPVEKHKHTNGSGKKPKIKESTRLKDLSGIKEYEWLKLLDQRDDVIRVYVDERHETFEARHQGMTAAAKIILTIILTAMTGGGGLLGAGGSAGGAAAGGAAAGGAATGAVATGTGVAVGTATSTVASMGLATKMATAAMTALKAATISHFAVGAIDQRGRMDRVAESFVFKDNLKGLAVTVLSSALTAGISHSTGIKTTNMNGFTEQLKGNTVKGLSSFAANTAVHGKAGQALKKAAIQVGVDTASGTLANKIGLRREAELQNGDTVEQYILHKLDHALLGLAKGGVTAVLDGKSGKEITSAMFGGAIGGVAAEVVGEALRDNIAERTFKRLLEGTTTDQAQIEAEELERIRSLAQIAAVSTATLCGVDIEAACDAAQNAIENNAVGSVIYYGVMGGLAVWSACDVYDTYQQHGAEAALLKAGIEITTMVAGNAVVKRGYQIAGKFYPSAELAWAAYIAENPRVAAVAEYCVNKTGRIKDYVTDSRVGHFIKDIDNAAEAKFKNWFGKEAVVDSSLEAERFWTKRIEFKGNKVYQRDDLIDPHFIGVDGRTNLQRMKMGHAPLTEDGKSINLHHMLQTQKGPIAEVSEAFHQGYAEIIHINPTSIPSGINRSYFDRWRSKYWAERAKDFEG
ncbi:MAG: HNH/ENDO VII family nuclease [Candidatus Paracaedibacteraceae bacterium]|nr:HNH/ENDO VII family nuclease [Candidatus Paracaedibacteraceae bacterium]